MMTCREACGRFALLGALVLAPVLTSCGGGPAGTQLGPTEGQMIGHFGRFSEIQSSLVMGDLPAAQAAAQSLAGRDFPPTRGNWGDALKSAAHTVATSTDFETAAQAAGTLVQTCGSCHAEVGVTPNVRFAPGAPRGGSRAEHMARDMWAVDQLMDGMVGNDNEFWMNGAGALSEDEHMADMGAQVMAAQGDQRAIVYGRVLKACADCHTR